MSEGTGRSLTRGEFDAVIRRAAELSSSDPGTAEGELTESEVYRIAAEVGLAQGHVRRALAEVRSGGEVRGALDRIFGPASVRALRVVPGTPAGLSAALDEFLVANRLLQPVRRGASLLQYRPALDWASQLARAASFSSRKYYIASARSVEVHLESVSDDRTLVEILVDPGTRGDDVAGAVIGTGAGGGGAGALAGFVLASVTPIGFAVGAGVVIAGGVGALITYSVGNAHKKKLGEVQTEIEGVLDALEMGRSLEPPPASWRRWVKRHFHGVARELMSTEEDTDVVDDVL